MLSFQKLRQGADFDEKSEDILRRAMATILDIPDSNVFIHKSPVREFSLKKKKRISCTLIYLKKQVRVVWLGISRKILMQFGNKIIINKNVFESNTHRPLRNGNPNTCSLILHDLAMILNLITTLVPSAGCSKIIWCPTARIP